MVTSPQIFTATVMHRRLLPTENKFQYGVYYGVLPLPVQPIAGCLVRFDTKDLGDQDGGDLDVWARKILSTFGLNDIVDHITLVTMPRVMGYVFNPVSFYFCFDVQGDVRSVLCEVHNTFGERHTYLCVHPDHSPIARDQWLEAQKVFHVSPFLKRTGTYKFRFDWGTEKCGIWIDYYNDIGQKQLVTSLIGSFSPMTSQTVRRAFWRHPLVTLKTIMLIHWQALRLILKGISYIPKPIQFAEKITTSHDQNKQ